MPVQETLSKFNWIDIVVVSLILITSYKGSKDGFIRGAFKLLGVVFALCVSLHYFSKASDELVGRFSGLGVVFSDLLCFILLAIISYLAIAALRETLGRFLKVEAVSALDRWGALILGFLRGAFLVSLLLIVFCLSSVTYLKASVKKSYLGSQLLWTDVSVYEFIFNGMISKFSPGENLNKDIYEALNGKEGAG